MCPTHDVVHQEPIKLRAFVNDVLATFEASAQARHIILDALVFSEELKADADLLHRLLASFVAGAIQRAPAGTNVSLVVSPRANYVEFRVADEGAGIALATRPEGVSAAATGMRGDGSGLTFCRLAAEAMGGRVSVAETDSGTVVCLALPSQVGLMSNQPAVDVTPTDWTAELKPGETHRESGVYLRADQATAITAPQTLLVVNDEPLVRAFVARALRDAGYGVIEADCAELAMDILTANQQPIALLLSEVGLPGASGAELVRQAHRLIPKLPALLMSASTKRALRDNGVLVGDTRLLQKPFAFGDLLAALEELLPLPSARAALGGGETTLPSGTAARRGRI